jgi:hypothetical protein
MSLFLGHSVSLTLLADKEIRNDGFPLHFNLKYRGKLCFMKLRLLTPKIEKRR